jgi:YesN/AraC family two-component response regulator
MLDQILIVDDDNIFRKEIVEFLRDEYSLIEAATGEEALDLLAKPNSIALIILDVRLPGLNGVRVLEKIKKTDPGVKVLINTGYSEKDVVIECLKARADDFIEKNKGPDSIKKVIRKHLAIRKGTDNLEELDIKGKLRVVKDFIERNWCKKVGLDRTARLIHVSPKYLSRVFKEQTGLSFNDFRIKDKIQKSVELLKNPGFKIDQIAEKIGYIHTESYIRAFYKIMKSSPSAYRHTFLKSYLKKNSDAGRNTAGH